MHGYLISMPPKHPRKLPKLAETRTQNRPRLTQDESMTHTETKQRNYSHSCKRGHTTDDIGCAEASQDGFQRYHERWKEPGTKKQLKIAWESIQNTYILVPRDLDVDRLLVGLKNEFNMYYYNHLGELGGEVPQLE